MTELALTATAPDAGSRLDQFLKRASDGRSRAALQKLIREGLCRINGEIVLNADRKIREGDLIQLAATNPQASPLPEKGEINLLWRDEELAVCDKPAGLTVHPAASQTSNTLAQRLLHRFPALAMQGGARPGIVHRLDKDTSGLIMAALTEKTRLALTRAFAERQVHKEYLALVFGEPPTKGVCREPVGRHPSVKTKMAVVPEKAGGKPAYTAWRKLWTSPDGKLSLLAVKILTGRTHQIRVHMASLGHPVVGDRTYAFSAAKEMAPRQLLHAWKLRFIHPQTGELMSFCAPPPEDFMATITKFGTEPLKVVVTGNQGCGKSSFCRYLTEAGVPGVDADKIVAELYSGPGAVADWLKIRGYANILDAGDRVNKERLLNLFVEKPDVKKEFTPYVHRLVEERIREFWRTALAGRPAIAEIPLYFEANMQKTLPAFTVGVACDEDIRRERLRRNRGWPDSKIDEIESWQLPEKEKMSRCDLVIANTGDENALRLAAKDFLEFCQTRINEKETALENHARKIFSGQIP